MLQGDWASVIDQFEKTSAAHQERLADRMMRAETWAQVVSLEEADKQDSLEPDSLS